MHTHGARAIAAVVPAVRHREAQRAAYLSLALALGSGPLAAQSPLAQVTVLRAARMIDGSSSA